MDQAQIGEQIIHNNTFEIMEKKSENSRSRWYVLQVLTGTEAEVQKELIRRGVAAVVPVENRMIRQGGKWKEREYIVFPGYVFINVRYSWSQYYIMAGIRQIVRILGGGEKPEPLSEDEVKLLIRQTELFREPSVLRVSGSGYEIESGALKELSDQIKKVDLHSRRAVVKLMIAGTETEIKLSFKVKNAE